MKWSHISDLDRTIVGKEFFWRCTSETVDKHNAKDERETFQKFIDVFLNNGIMFKTKEGILASDTDGQHPELGD